MSTPMGCLSDGSSAAGAISSKKRTGRKTKLWRGVFNFRKQVIIKYLRAYSDKQAKVFMMRRIASEHNVPYSYVFGLFDGHMQNFSIEEEIA